MIITILSFLLGVTSMKVYLDWKAKKEEDKLHQDMSEAFTNLTNKINEI